MCPAQIQDGHRRGHIIPIGGGEEKISDAAILRQFTELSGGREARIVIIPTASRLKDTGRQYEQLFHNFKVAAADILTIDTRQDASNEAYLTLLQQASGVFMTGGNQLRLSTILGGTPLARLIRRRNADGVPVAGTSAGAAFLCEHMIASGEEGPTPRRDAVALAPGLGLTNRMIIDQHFRQRDRLGRLLAALAFNPFAFGIGLDEDTAAFIDADDVIDIKGSGALTIIDPSQLEYSSMAEADKGDPINLVGVQLHILSKGSRYDAAHRLAIPGKA